jgi:hypothetical protein
MASVTKLDNNKSTPENCFIDLLTWVRDEGLTPSRFNRRDHFLDLFSRRIKRFNDLRPHQMATTLWIPNEQGLKAQGVDVKVQKDHDVFFVTVKRHNRTARGAGFREPEAVLSALNQVRRATREPLRVAA